VFDSFVSRLLKEIVIIMPDPSTIMKPWEEQASNLLGKLWAGKMLAVEVSDILIIWSQNRLGKNSAKAYNCAIEAFLFEAPLFQTFPEAQKAVAFELLELLATNSAHTTHAKAIEDAEAAAAKGITKKAPDSEAKLKSAGWGDRVRKNITPKSPPQEALDLKLVPPPPGLELPAMAFCQSPPGLESLKEEVKSRPETPVSPFRVRRAGSRGRGA
jgi:hypothetical protein